VTGQLLQYLFSLRRDFDKVVLVYRVSLATELRSNRRGGSKPYPLASNALNHASIGPVVLPILWCFPQAQSTEVSCISPMRQPCWIEYVGGKSFSFWKVLLT
jgi:hypothetical protein